MAKKKHNSSSPSPSSSSDSGKRGLLSRIDRIFLIICLLIFLYVGLKQCGFDMVSRTEKIEMTNDPHK